MLSETSQSEGSGRTRKGVGEVEVVVVEAVVCFLLLRHTEFFVALFILFFGFRVPPSRSFC